MTSSSQHKLVLVSPILNIQTHKTPFSHSCLSSYSHFPFSCEHIEGSDTLATWSFSPHCGLFKPFSKVFSLLFFARCRNENIIFTICNTTTQLHFSFEILSSFGLCYSVLSDSPPNFLSDSSVSFKGSASFPHQASGNLLNDSVVDYLLFLLLLLCSITCKYSCSYHIFVAVSQIYFAMYGTISFTSCLYMTLINTSLLSILPNYFVAEWETESFCSLQMEEGWRKGFLLLFTT